MKHARSWTQFFSLCMVAGAMLVVLLAAQRLSSLQAAPQLAFAESAVLAKTEGDADLWGSVSVQAIKPFAYYHVNAVNPFLPFHLRHKQSAASVQQLPLTATSATTTTQPSSNGQEPANDAAKQAQLPKPDLSACEAETVPQLIGELAMAEQGYVLVQVGQEQRHIELGDSIGNWTMTAYKRGLVTLKHADGRVLAISVPQTSSVRLPMRGQ